MAVVLTREDSPRAEGSAVIEAAVRVEAFPEASNSLVDFVLVSVVSGSEIVFFTRFDPTIVETFQTSFKYFKEEREYLVQHVRKKSESNVFEKYWYLPNLPFL